MDKNEKIEDKYLNEIFFRFHFSRILNLSSKDESSAELFRKHIFNEFPRVTVKQNYDLNFGLNLESKEFEKRNQKNNLLWVFTDHNNNKMVELSDSHLSLKYNKKINHHFKYFLDDVKLLLDALIKYSPINPIFIELRYIYQLSGKPLEKISQYINNVYYNPEILTLNGENNFVQNLSRLTLNNGKYLLNFQYGLFNLAYPEVEFDKDFIFDFDCEYYNILSLDEIPNELKEMNEFIRNHFQTAITDKLKYELQGEE